MSIFIARHFKIQHDRSSLYEISNELLPRAFESESRFIVKKSDAIVFFFNASLDRKPVQLGQDEIIICQGYGDKNLEYRIGTSFQNEKAIDLVAFPEAFCAIRVHENGLQFAGSAVGADPLFFYEDINVVVVTNRHNLLSPWMNDFSLRKQSLAWIVGRGHIGDFATYWEKIKKSRPGSLYSFSGSSSSEVKVKYEKLFEPIADNEIPHRIRDISVYFQDLLDSSKSPVRFWLSGGKDSRAIAGLVSGADRFKEITFQTHGEKFSPDVMAAAMVADKLGVYKNYSTARSSLTEPTIDLARAIANDLLSDCTGGSLADFRSIPNSNLLIFGGHESGYKAQPNNLNLMEYINSRNYWPDNQKILKNETYDHLFTSYKNDLKDLLQDAPKDRFSQLEALVYVIGTRVTGAHVNSHISRSEIHPFLDGRMARLLFGVSNEALKNQVIHYVMMRQNPSAIESLPFAADNWPVGTADFVKNIGLPFRATIQNAYVFRDYFPSQKNFGGYSWRLDLIQRTRSFVNSYIHDNKAYFDFIDIDRLDFLHRSDIHTLKISSIYFHLAVLKVCLIHYFNENRLILNFKNLNIISDHIQDIIGEAKMKNNEANIISVYKAKIDDYENAIALIAERDRAQDERVKKTTNNYIAHALASVISEDHSRLVSEMHNLRYFLLSNSGLHIPTEGKKINIQGYVLNLSKTPNTLLISVKNRSINFSLIDFNWSESGNFWFKYVAPVIAGHIINIEIDLGPFGGEIWLLPWHCKEPIFFSDIVSVKNTM